MLTVVPFHPIFVEEPAPIYLLNDFFHPRWSGVVPWTLEARPAAVLVRRWDRLVQVGQITEAQRRQLVAFLEANYTIEPFGARRFWVLREGRGD